MGEVHLFYFPGVEVTGSTIFLMCVSSLQTTAQSSLRKEGNGPGAEAEVQSSALLIWACVQST